jgi:hypothetical protein
MNEAAGDVYRIDGGGPACRPPFEGSPGRVVHTARPSGRPFEALFDPRAGDDLVAIAEAHPGAKRAMIVPKLAELGIEAADLFLDLRVVLGGEAMPEFAALFTEALDLCVNGCEGGDGHVS